MSKIKIHPTTLLLFFIPFFKLLSWGEAAILWTGAVFHEIGHIAAYRLCGTEMESVTVLPFGLCAVPKNPIKISPENEIFCAAAGPLANLILSLLLLALPLPSAHTLVRYALYCNLTLFLINILPILPLDGGRILYFSLARTSSLPVCERICRKSGTVVLCLLLIPASYTLIWEKNFSLSMIWGYLLVYHRLMKGSL